MEKTAETSTPQQTAYYTYLWYIGSLESQSDSQVGLRAIQSFLGSFISTEQLLQFGHKFRQSKGFTEARQQIIDQWAHLMEPTMVIDEQQALQFIQQLFQGFDHSMLYDDQIIANSTHIKRGKLSDREINFSGTMPCWTLHLTTEGEALFLNQQMEVNVKAGDMMLFQPEASYHYGLHPLADNWRHHWALFQPKPHWQQWLAWQQLDNGIMHLSLNDEQQRHCIGECFQQLIALQQEAHTCQSELQHNRLEEILIRAWGNRETKQAKVGDQRIEKACQFMQQHMAERFNVDDVANACNLSPSRIAHLFKQQMGVSLKSWSNNLRLQQARKLLLHSDDSISSIGKKIGYDDPAQFTKSFKNNMNCSPRNFRQSFKK